MEEIFNAENSPEAANNHINHDIKQEREKTNTIKLKIKDLEILRSEILINIRRIEVR